MQDCFFGVLAECLSDTLTQGDILFYLENKFYFHNFSSIVNQYLIFESPLYFRVFHFVITCQFLKFSFHFC